MKKKRNKSPYTKEENVTRFSLLALFVATLLVNFFKLLYNKIDRGFLYALDAMNLAFYLGFLAEYVFRMRKIYLKDGKKGIVGYFKFNKAEPLYMVVAPVVLICSLVVGGNQNGWEAAGWIIFLKMPYVMRRFNDETVFNVICKIIMAALILVFVVPFINLIAYSFSSPHLVVGLVPNGFTTYSMSYILKYAPFWKSLGVSVCVTICGTLGSVFIMTLCAYPLSKTGMPFRKGVLVYFLICMLFSGGMAPKIILMNALNLLDTFWALVLPSLINVFNLLLLKGFFEGLPAELEESAKLDGANNYQILFKIVVPLAMPMVATVCMFTAIAYWNNFNNALLYVMKKDLFPLPMFIRDFTNLNEQSFSQIDPVLADHIDNLKMALMLCSIIPIFAVYPFTLRFFTKGVAVGAVKG